MALSGLTAEIRASIAATIEKEIAGVGTPKDVLNISKLLSLTFGNGAGKADQIYYDRNDIAASGSDDLDMAGVLTNIFGETISFDLVRAVMVLNRSDEAIVHGTHTVATDAEISIGGSGGFEWVGPFAAVGDKMEIPAGGLFIMTNPTAAGWVVGPGATDLLGIDNLDGADVALYDIVIIGEEA